MITFFICVWLYQKKHAYQQNGLLTGVFFIGIFLSRFLLEFIKNNQESFEENMVLNMGQWLSIPLILWGTYLIYKALKKNNKNI